MKIHTTQVYLKQSRWLVFAVRVTFNEHNLSIIGAIVGHNRKNFGAVQHSIIGTFFSIIGSALAIVTTQLQYSNNIQLPCPNWLPTNVM